MNEENPNASLAGRVHAGLKRPYQCLHHVGSLQSEALYGLEDIQDAFGLHPLQNCTQRTESASTASASTANTQSGGLTVMLRPCVLLSTVDFRQTSTSAFFSRGALWAEHQAYVVYYVTNCFQAD